MYHAECRPQDDMTDCNQVSKREYIRQRMLSSVDEGEQVVMDGAHLPFHAG